MRHYIIVKFKPEVDWGVLVEPIRALFQRTLDIEGITGELHFRWKETYGPLLESKIIFDRES